MTTFHISSRQGTCCTIDEPFGLILYAQATSLFSLKASSEVVLYTVANISAVSNVSILPALQTPPDACVFWHADPCSHAYSHMLFAQYFYDSTAYKRQTSLLSAFDVAKVRLNGALREREVQERTKNSRTM